MRVTKIKRVDSNNMSFLEASKMFIQDKMANGISDSSVGNYKVTFDIFLRDTEMGYDYPLSCINKQLINTWILKLKERCTVGSINHYLVDIKAFCNWCFRNGYLEEFEIKKMKGQESELRYFSDEELKTLTVKPKADCSFVESRTYAIVCFILATGARASTICNIKVEDVDFQSRQISYTHLKNKSFAVVPMSASLCNILKSYLQDWRRENATWLFPDCAEGQLTVSALRQALNKYCEDRGVKTLGPHALRYSFARCWIMNDGNIITLQHMLTHADIQMTKHYIHLFSNDYKKDFEMYSPLDNIKAANDLRRIRRA